MQPAYFQSVGTLRQLMVDGKPAILLAGELHNSSSSSPAYMEPVWPHLRALNLNTVLAAVSWELVEAQEGRFDFSSVDSLLEGARVHDLRLVLLWFGTWKNTDSGYVPTWVKADQTRFPRALRQNGTKNSGISCFSQASMEADARAFSALMQHLAETDTARTVVMVQVENETGVLGSDRDYSEEATRKYREPLPQELADYLLEHRAELSPFLSARTDFAALDKSWERVFSEDAEEIFMAYYTARYVGFVAREGKHAYGLPMYANAWTVQCPDEPGGMHPSGGPVADLHDIWRCAAPELDAFAPDLYLENFEKECSAYTRLSGNPLLIPEMRNDRWIPAEAFYAVAEHGAVCVSPFGIDDLITGAQPAAAGPVQEVPQPDNPANVPGSLQQTYGVLRKLMPLLTKHQPFGRVRGVMQDRLAYHVLRFERYFVKVIFTHALAPGRIPAGGLVIGLSENEFVLAGMGYAASFFPRKKAGADYVQIEEGAFEGERWVPERRLNGDERSVRFGDTPQILKVHLYDFD